VAATLLLASTATSNVGVALTGAVALSVLLTRGWRYAALVAGVPAAGYLAWYVAWGHREPSACPGKTSLLAIPAFVAKGAEKGLSGLIGMQGGSLLVLGLLGCGVYQVLSHRQWRVAAWALSSTVGCVGLYLLSAIGRSACEVDASRAPRYAYFAVLVVPLLGFALNAWWQRSRAIATVITAAVLVCAGLNLAQLDELYVCRKARVDAGFAQLSYLPAIPSGLNPQATAEEIDYLKQHFRLQLRPAGPTYPPTEVGC
jgi:hypothetical protein